MTERDFVLNNYFQPCFDLATKDNAILELKNVYRTIIENTSDESESNDDFLFYDINNEFQRIKFDNIDLIREREDRIEICNDTRQVVINIKNEDKIKFKQWFERKRGGK